MPLHFQMTRQMPMKCFLLCLLTCITTCMAETGPESEEKASANPQPPQLSHFDRLWKSSMFTTHELKVEAPVVENAEWGANLELSGWSEVDGRLLIYLFRADTEQTFILHQDEPAEAGVLQFVALENPESIFDARARVRLNGQEAWIGQRAETGAPQVVSAQPQPQSAQDAQPVSAGFKAPTTVDSRAARLRSGIVLTANTTFEDSLDQSPANIKAPSTPAAQSEQQPAAAPVSAPTSNLSFIQQLRERNEHRYRTFPRQEAGP